MARPSKLTPDLEKLILKCYALWGATDKEIAELCEVTEQTVNNWKLQKPEFFELIKAAKAKADARVEKALYRKAIGYSHIDTEFATYKGEITDERQYTKHLPPDSVACIFWLTNRQPERWRHKRTVEHSGKVDVTPALYIVERQLESDSDTADDGSPGIH